MPKVLFLFLFSFSAFAQDSVLVFGRDDARETSRSIKLSGVVGSGYLNEPFVMGSAASKPIFYPFLDLTVNDRITINSDDGIYVQAFKTPWFEVGAHAFYSWGREGDYYRSEDRAETESVSESIVAGLSIWREVGPGEVTLSWDHGLSPGQSGRVNLSYSLHAYDRGRWRVEVAPEVNWDSSEYMNTFFGVTPESSEETGLAAYHPSAGFESVGARVSLRYRPPIKHLVAQASVAYHELIDEARRSPLNETTSMKSLFLALGYEVF